MKVLFIWIENYKGLSNLGLNFSNEYNISFNKDTKTLSIEDNEDYIEGFFGNKISNLTAIVGKNGVGKSSIISFWTNYLISGNGAVPSDESFILYTRDTEDLHLCCANNKPLIDNKTSKRLNNDNKWPKCDLVVNVNNIIDISSTFDKNSTSYDEIKSENHEQMNLTTYYLLSKAPMRTHSSNDFKSHIESFALEEIRRIVNLIGFVNKDKEKRSPLNIKSVQLPKYLRLDIRPTSENQITEPKAQANEIEHFTLDLLSIIINEIIFDVSQHPNTPELPNDNSGSISDQLRTTTNTYFETNFQNSSIPSIISEIIQRLDAIAKKTSNRVLKNNIQVLNHLTDKLLRIESSSYHINKQSIIIELNSSTFDTVNNILALLNRFQLHGKSYELSFCHNDSGETGLSSGEYQLLTTLGRLNSIFENGEQKNSYTILLDEIDIGLHPQWQKEVIKHLIDFINENEAFARQTIQGEKVNKPFIQLIITSHSPFVLSDIPKNCVILLDKKGDEVVVKSLPKLHNTFGMNIHELFTDSFFLQDGLMGEFARTEIHKLIERINNEKKPITADFYEECKKRIQIIGEPFLRKKIMELLHSKLEEEDFIDDIRLEEQIKQKQEELKQLELRRAKKQ